MKRNNRRTARGLAATLGAAAIVVGVNFPAMASTPAGTSSVTLAASRDYGYNNGGYNNNNYRYNRGSGSYNGSAFTGTISRVDQGQRVFRLYTSNGQSYHVDASNATILVNGATTSFSQLPTSGTVQVIGTLNNDGSITASEVDFGGNGYYGNGNNNYRYNHGSNNGAYNNNGYNNNYRYNHGSGSYNGSGFVGTISRVDQGQQVFRLYTSNGQSYHVDASNATILVNGATTSFSQLPTSGTVQVIGTLNNDGSITASEVDFGGNGNYGNGNNNYRYNHSYNNSGNNGNHYGWRNGNNGNHDGWRNHDDNNDNNNDGD